MACDKILSVHERIIMAGRFITIEGGEGAGKSSQILRLEQRLKDSGYEIIRTREPGGSDGAEAIRNLLVQGEVNRWDAVSEVLLFLAARRDHVEKKIKPALRDGCWVICDRYQDSTLAYQAYARGLGVEYVNGLYLAAIGNFWPDMTLILDIDPEVGLKRARSSAAAIKNDRFEAEALDFHQRLREGFLDIAAKNQSRCKIIDASGDVDAVHERVWLAVQENYGAA